MRWNRFLTALPLLVVLPAGAQLTRKAPPDVEAALKARVSQFYGLFQQAKFRQAESLIAEESRDIFYNMSKVPISDYRIDNIDFDDSFQTAKVLVLCVSNTPRTAGLGMYIPVTGKWKLMDGQWYLVIEPRTTTPFGPIGPKAKEQDQQPKQPGRLQTMERPSIETITRGAFSVEPERLVFPRQGGQAVTRSVVVRNNLPGILNMEIEGADLPGLKLIVTDKTIPPNSQMAFRLLYNPQVGNLHGTQEITVRLEPIGQTKTIRLEFE